MISNRDSVKRAVATIVDGRAEWASVEELPLDVVELRQDDYAFTARVLKLDDAGTPRHRWSIYEFPAGMDVPYHATATIDYAMIIDGELDLILPDQPPLHFVAGDCIVQQGAPHKWRTGPDSGATISVVVLHDE